MGAGHIRVAAAIIAAKDRGVPPQHGHARDRSQIEGNREMPRYAGPQTAVAVLLMSLSLWLRPTAAPAIDVGDQAPDFIMHSTEGETVRLPA
jgi:hypothetical protein